MEGGALTLDSEGGGRSDGFSRSIEQSRHESPQHHYHIMHHQLIDADDSECGAKARLTWAATARTGCLG